MNLFLTLCLVALPAIVSCANIPQTLRENGLTALADTLDAAGLTSTLEGAGPFTVFAPTNEALAKVPSSVTRDSQRLNQILLFHVLSGAVRFGDLSNDLSVNTVEGSPVRINIYERKSMLHGKTVTVNGIRICSVDIEADNGVIHVIHDVLIPENRDIVGVLTSAENTETYSTLVTAVTEASLVQTLQAAGPYTVFAPTNEAFAKLPPGTLESVLADKQVLTDLLLNHVVNGTVFAAGVRNANVPTFGSNRLTTESGYQRVTVRTEGKSRDEASVVVQPNLVATNGVVHGIDKVIL